MCAAGFHRAGGPCRRADGAGRQVGADFTHLLFDDQQFAAGALREHGLKLGYENHQEHNGREVLSKLGDENADCNPDVVGQLCLQRTDTP